MAIIFNADEALAMAEQIERNGRKFYIRAAEIAVDSKVNKLLTELAEWEKGHEELYASMRKELDEGEKRATTFDPYGDAELYLQAMADTHVFNVTQDPTSLLSEDKSPAQILETALTFERDSILFFTALAEVVPERLGTDKVDRIVKEEVGHVTHLKRQMQQLKGR